MSRADFSNLAIEHPEFAELLRRVDGWLQSHPQIRYVDPARLAKDFKDITEDDLLIAFAVLVSAGKLRRLYRVRPRTSYTFVNGVFESPAEIPQTLRDSVDNIVDLDDAEVVTVFGRAGGGER